METPFLPAIALACPPSVPVPGVLWEALARPDLIEILGAIRLMAKLSVLLRGDSIKAGWSILVDGSPAFFAVKMDHNRRKIYGFLAGLREDEFLASLPVTYPTKEAINEAMLRAEGELSPRWRVALEMMEANGELGG